MKTRILVAVVCIPVLLAIIFFLPIWAFGILAAAICGCAAWEFLRCTAPDCPFRHQICAALAGAAIPLGTSLGYGELAVILPLFLLALILFAEVIFTYGKENALPYESVLRVLAAGVIIPLMLSALVRLGCMDAGPVLIMLSFVITFSCDSGAYFAGVFLGKHKMAPRVSPNKTIEGSIGGMLASILITALYGVILSAFEFQVNYLNLLIYGLLGGVICQLGDLVFSVIKRQCGIKDYGNLIPGHGGALDRFDSAVFVAPMVEILMLLIPAITK